MMECYENIFGLGNSVRTGNNKKKSYQLFKVKAQENLSSKNHWPYWGHNGTSKSTASSKDLLRILIGLLVDGQLSI